MTILVILTASVGSVSIAWAAFGTRERSDPRLAARVMLAWWLGAVATLVLSIPETRFAVPVVAMGLVGVLVGWGLIRETPSRRRRVPWMIGVALGLAVALCVIGSLALRHPVDPGPLRTAKACAQLLP